MADLRFTYSHREGETNDEVWPDGSRPSAAQMRRTLMRIADERDPLIRLTVAAVTPADVAAQDGVGR